jgi:hypothetical protein
MQVMVKTSKIPTFFKLAEFRTQGQAFYRINNAWSGTN